MKKARSIARRATSLVLCAALLMGLIVGVQVSTTITANAGLSKETVKAPFAFQVPETIWLEMNTGETNQIAYWSNQEANGNVPASPVETIGKVHFTVPGAVTIVGLENDAGIDVGTPQNPAGSIYTWEIKDKDIDTALAAGETRLVKWTLTCKMGGEILTFLHYSLLWAPTTVITGAGSHAAVDDTTSSTVLTLLGADGIVTSAFKAEALSGNQHNSMDTSNSTVYAAKQNMLEDIVSGSHDHGASTTSLHDTSLGLMEQKSGGGIAYGIWPNKSEAEPKQAVSGVVAKMLVDNSRFGNLQQVPGLKVNLLFSNRQDTQNSFGSENSRVEFPEGTNLQSLSTVSSAPAMVLNVSTPATGSKFNFGLSSADTETITLFSHLRTYQKNWLGADTDDIVVDYRTDLMITKVDKTDLRRSVTSAVKYPQEWIVEETGSGGYDAFLTALQEAADVLGDPRGDSVGLDEIEELDDQVENTTPQSKNIIPTFYAPETIYLNPSKKAETEMEEWQYFADDNYDGSNPTQFGAPNADKAKTSGTLYFYCEAASSVTITAQDITNGSNSFSFVSSGGSIGETIEDNQVLLTFSDKSESLNKNALIRWTAEYIIDGTAFQSFAYSYIYKPYVGVTGTAIAAGNEVDIQMMLWWLGLHSVDREELKTTQYRWPNEADEQKKKSISSYDFTVNGATTTPMVFMMDPNENLTTLVQQGNKLPFTGIENQVPTSVNNPYRTEANGAVWDLMSPNTNTHGAATGTGSIRFQAQSGAGPNGNTSPLGHLYVDSSRYDNLEQVPNLDWLFINTDDWGGSPNDGKVKTKDAKYWFFNQIGNKDIYIPGGTRSEILNEDNRGTIYYNWSGKVDDREATAQGFWSSGYRFGNKDNTKIARNNDKDGVAGDSGAWGVADGGIKGSFNKIAMNDFPLWSPTTLRSTVGLYVSSASGGDWTIENGATGWNGSFTSSGVSGKTNQTTAFTQTQINIARVDKNDLRNKLQTEIKKGLQENQLSNWPQYLQAMDDLALALCKPDYALTSTENAALISDLTAERIYTYTGETNVYLNVPELIYLTPSTANGTAKMQYFANNVADRAPLEKLETYGEPSNKKNDTTGIVWFHVPGAVKMSLHLDKDFVEYPGDITSGNGLTGTKLGIRYLERPGDTGGTAVYQERIYDDFDPTTNQGWATPDADWVYGEISAADSESYNESKHVRWKGVYQMPGDTEDRIVYAYTYIYKPYDGIYGSAHHTKQNSSINDSITWFMGVHDVAKEPLNALSHNSNDYSGIRQVWDYDDANNLTSSNGSSAAGSSERMYLSTLSSAGSGITNYFTNTYWSSLYLNKSSRTATGNGGAFSYMYTEYDSGTTGMETRMTDSPHGKLYVDVSRYQSIYDVPNFQWSTIQADTYNSDGTWLLEFPGINDNGVLNGGEQYWNRLNVRYGFTNSNNKPSGNPEHNKRYPYRMGPNLMAGVNVPTQYVNAKVYVDGSTSNASYTAPGGATGDNWRSTDYLMNRLDTLGRWDGKGDSVQYYHYVYGITTDVGTGSITDGMPWNFNMTDETVTNTDEKKGIPVTTIEYTRQRSRVVTDLRLIDKAPLREQLQLAMAQNLQVSDMGEEAWNDYQAQLAKIAMELCRPDSDVSALEMETLFDGLYLDQNVALNKHYNLAKLDSPDFTEEEALIATEQLGYSLHETVLGSAWCEEGVNEAEASVSDDVFEFHHHELTLGGGDTKESTAASSSVIARGFEMLWQMYYYPRYTIEFHENEGQGEMDPQAMVYGTTEPLNMNAFHRDQYVFVGWATSPEEADKGIVAYYNQEEVENLTEEPGDVIDLYAVWDEVNYNVTWIAGWEKPGTNSNPRADLITADVGLGDWAGNTNGYHSTGFESSETVPVYPFAADPTRVGFTFYGWAASEQEALDGAVELKSAGFAGKTNAQLAELVFSDELSQWYARGTDETVPSAVQKYILFWAAWQPNEYKVVFDATDGKFDPTGKNVQTWGNADKQYFDAEYPYEGLASSTPKTTETPEEGATQYDITSATDYYYNIPVPVRSGYVFDGWAIEEGGEVEFEQDFSYTTQELAELLGKTEATTELQTLTFYAVWSEADNYVAFEAGEGEFNPEKTQPGTVKTNALFSTATNWMVPTKIGKTFLGYVRQGDTTETIISADTITLPEHFNVGATEGNPTVYVAVFADTAYFVQFASEDGTTMLSPVISVKYNSEFGSYGGFPETATAKDGYVFDKWVSTMTTLEVDAAGEAKTNTTLSIVEATPTVFTATYVPAKFYIAYDFGDGSTPVESDLFAFDEDDTRLKYSDDSKFTSVSGDNAPSKSGHIFTGWKEAGNDTIPADGNKNVSTSLSTDPDEPTVFVAQFAALEYTIAYKANGGEFDTSGSDTISSVVTFGDPLSNGTPAYAEPTRIGYDFAGWGLTNNATVDIIPARGSTVLNDDLLNVLGLDGSEDELDVTVFAIWTAKTTQYKVRVYLQDENGVHVEDVSKAYYGNATTNQTVTLTDTALPTYTDYTRNSDDDADLTKVVAYSTSDANYTEFKLYYDRTKVQLSYDLTGGGEIKGAESPETGAYIWGSTKPVTTVAEKTGYSFEGWQVKSGEVTSFEDGVLVFAKDNVVLEPVWQGITYTLQYSAGSYTGVAGMPEATVTVTYDPDGTTTLAGPPSLTGYDFAGWVVSNATKEGANVTLPTTTTALPNDLRTTTGTVTLTASFTAEKYYIKYSMSTPVSSTVIFGEKYIGETETMPTPAAAEIPAGKYFVKWVSGSNEIATGEETVPAGLSTNSGLPTIFTPEYGPLNYTIIYDATDGSFADDAQTNEVSTDFEARLIDGTTYKQPSQTGYVFEGWALEGDKTTVVISNEAMSTAVLNETMLTTLDLDPADSDSVTLYAVWSASTETKYELQIYLADADGNYQATADKTHTITNGTTGEKPYATSPYALVAADTADFAYYVFEKGNNGEAIAADGNTVYKLYYKRTAYSFKVVDDGTTVSETSHAWGKTVNLPANPEKPGFTFTGWSLTGAVLEAGATSFVMGKQAAVLTAQYDELRYYLNFNYNGGDPSDAVCDTTYDASKTFGSLSGFVAAPQRDGYTFDGWLVGGTKVTLASSTALPFDSLSTTEASPTVYTAQWTANTTTGYQVKVWLQNLDGSYSLDESATKTYTDGTSGASMTLEGPKIPGAPTGYTRVTEYSATTPITLMDTQTIAGDGSTVFKYYFARSENRLIIVNNNDGQAGPVSPTQTFVWGSAYTIPSIPVNAGYDFVKWNISNTEEAKVELKAGEYVVTIGKGDTTVTAEWTPKTFDITYDFQGGTDERVIGQTEDSTVRYTETYGAGTFWPAPTKPGYTLVGWYTEPDGKGTGPVLAGSDVPTALPAGTIYYAYWTEGAVTYTVKIFLQEADGTTYTEKTEAKLTIGGVNTGDTISAGAEAFLSDYYTYNRERVTGTAAADSSAVLPVYFDRVNVSLHFDTAGGNAIAAQSARWGSDVNVSSIIPTRPGYNFLNWELTGGLEASMSADKKTVTLGKTNTTLQAKWAPNSFTLEFLSPTLDNTNTPTQALGQDGVAIPNAAVSYQGKIPTLKDPQNLAGYRFIGWFDKEGNPVNTGDTITFLTANGGSEPIIAYYAAEYTIRYDATEGTVRETGSPQTTDRLVWWGAKYQNGIAAAGDAFPDAEPPAGYTFGGWYTEKDGGSKVTADMPVPLLREPGYLPGNSPAPKLALQSDEVIDQILYAHWDPVTIGTPDPEPDPGIPAWIPAVLGTGLLATGVVAAVKVTSTLLGASLLGTLLIPITALLPKLADLLKPTGDKPSDEPPTTQPPEVPGEDPPATDGGDDTTTPIEPPVKTPNTGDSTPIVLLAVLLMNGFAAGGIPLLRRRKKEEA